MTMIKVPDTEDAFRLDACASADTDGDGDPDMLASDCTTGVDYQPNSGYGQ